MPRVTEILLVEDDMVDSILTQRALADHVDSDDFHVNVVADGQEAVAFLRNQGAYSGAPTPDLILLDLGLPKKDGYQVLEEIKADARLHLIPIVVMTGTARRSDIGKTYGLFANCCVVKPVDPEGFASLIQSIRAFWLTTATLPSRVAFP